MRGSRYVVLTSLACFWIGGGANAQSAGNPAASPPAASPRVTDSPRSDEHIVVTAPRRGEAEVAAETEFDEEEIAGYGADNIDELIDRLAPLIDATGERPVILVNGEDIGLDLSILGYPAEALNRIAVLEPKAAAHYGHASDKRVVNLVLKKNYASRNADASTTWATAGGQFEGSLTAGQVAIAGPVRWNVQARIRLRSALRKSARDISDNADPVDPVGYVAPVGTAEIDPGLSEAAGGTVAAAAIPHSAGMGRPGLDDFVSTANRTDPRDAAEFETLLPSRRNISLNLGASRPVGPFKASLSVNASSSRSIRRRGLPMASLVLPSGNSWSPFSGDVLLVRPLAGDRALRSESSSRSLGFSLTLSGMLDGWRTNFSTNYTRSWATSLLERGIDTERAQAAIDANRPDFNPYGEWGEALLRTTDNRSNSESLNVRFNIAKPIVDLPAGSVTTNVSVSARRDRSAYRRFEGTRDTIAGDTSSREQLGGEIALAVPISRSGENWIGPLGDLALDLSMGGQKMSDSQLRKQYGIGFTWSPLPPLQISGSFRHREIVPSSDQLGAPRVETLNRIYDFSREEVAEPIWITGGNPLLRSGSRQNFSLDVKVQPFGSPVLTFNTSYRQQTGRGGIASFPELTPVIEAAFPERVTRDAQGRLVAVDARAINIARNTGAELVSGIALRLPAPGSKKPAKERSADPLRLSLALNHTWRLNSELLTRSGVPVIDRLDEGGQSRHFVSMQITAGKKGMGADLKATWSDPAQIAGQDEARQGYRFEPPILASLGLFVEPEDISSVAGKTSWLENVKVSLDIDNLFDTYRQVTLDDGTVPAGFSRYEVDPLGRTIELSIRKRF